MNYGKNRTSKKEKDLASQQSMAHKRFRVMFLKTFLICILIAVVVGAIAVFNMVRGIIKSAPDIKDIDATPTGYLSTVLDNNENEIATLVASGSNRVYVTIDEIPKNLQHAFVAIEDERFYDHNGIDLQGILRAGVRGITHGFHFSEGASTITQQLLKNNVFTGWTSESSFSDKLERKLQEQYLAVQLEKSVSKDWILENYLNSINLGQNTLGVQSASRRYFNKDVSELNISESAVIAAITQNPSRYNPVSNPDQNKKRRAAADVDKVGGKAVGVGCQLDDQHHKRRLQRQTGEQQLVVPDQLQVALHQHAKLAQEFQDFYWLHRLSASCAASGQAASRRLNSGVVKYFLR